MTLGQQHYGPDMDARHLPASWSATENALEDLLFWAKDALLVIDDFKPCGTSHAIAGYHARADRVLRAQGNNSARARMRREGGLQSNHPPRGLAMSTGEEIPHGESLRARTFLCQVSGGDINATALTACQADARHGHYARAMAGYLRWLAPRYELVRRDLRRQVELLRDRLVGRFIHLRTTEIVANLAIGLQHLLQFSIETGTLTSAEAEEIRQRGRDGLMAAASLQERYQSEQDPAVRFIELICSALASGQAHLAAKDGGEPPSAAAWGWRHRQGGQPSGSQPMGDRIGWIDGEDVYLVPDASYRAAQAQAGTSGDGLAVAEKTLRRHLNDRGWLIREPKRDELTVRRRAEGAEHRVLRLRADLIMPT